VTKGLLLLLKVSVGALILAVGMSTTFTAVAYLWRRPGLLLRSLLAMYLLVPFAAFLLVEAVPLSQGVKAALLVLAVSAGAPLLPRKLRRFGDDAYIFSLVVLSSLLAIVIVPPWIAALAWYFSVSTEISMVDVAKSIGGAFLLPLTIGMVSRAVAPTSSERFAGHASGIAGVALVVASLALLVTHLQLLAAVHWQGMMALIAMMVVGLAIGHILGGPDPDERTTLAIACVTRHVGVAVVVATSFRGPGTAVMLAAYFLSTALVTIAYLQWRRRKARPPGA
jgi:bile acid:Na+ symporter, BASS family